MIPDHLDDSRINSTIQAVFQKKGDFFVTGGYEGSNLPLTSSLVNLTRKNEHINIH